MGNIRAGTLIKFTKRLTVKCESWHPTPPPTLDCSLSQRTKHTSKQLAKCNMEWRRRCRVSRCVCTNVPNITKQASKVPAG